MVKGITELAQPSAVSQFWGLRGVCTGFHELWSNASFGSLVSSLLLSTLPCWYK